MVKPVLILQHLSTDGPAYLAAWLRRAGVPFEVRNTDAGDAYPAAIDGYGALAILGGEMSANDDLPSLRQAEQLFLQAHARGVPTIGHCLGGQLMARALGAAVTASPAAEVGWQPWAVHGHPLARAWFGPAPPARVFQWHGEAFGLPPGAVPLATSAACPHQAFSIGPHLAMQFHVEADADKIRFWGDEAGDSWLADKAAQHPSSVQGRLAMRDAAPLALQQALADHIYGHWLAQAARD